MITSPKLEFAQQLHQTALAVVQRYKQSEIELIEILEKVDAHKTFYILGFSSLFKYATDGLKLSEEIAYIFISVARKTREVPALKAEIKSGAISVSKAKRITPILNKVNQSEWLDLAKSVSKKELEKKVAFHSPHLAVQEKMQFVAASKEITENVKVMSLEAKEKRTVRVQLQLGVSEQLMLKLRRPQDVLSQRRRKSVSLEEVLNEMADLYIQKQDPLEKAKRQKMRGKIQDHEGSTTKGAIADSTHPLPELGPGPVNVDGALQAEPGRPLSSAKRVHLRSSVKHGVNLKYHRQCGHIGHNGKRCEQKRFLEVHHIKPISQGGSDDPENLILLCSGHHKSLHVSGLGHAHI